MFLEDIITKMSDFKKNKKKAVGLLRRRKGWTCLLDDIALCGFPSLVSLNSKFHLKLSVATN